MKRTYDFDVQYDRAVDGDTVDLIFDLGFSVSSKQRMRLHNVNAPELNDPDQTMRAKAIACKTMLHETLSKVSTIYVVVVGKDKYGRWVADIQITGQDGITVSLNGKMNDFIGTLN